MMMRFARSELPDTAFNAMAVPHARKQVDALCLVRRLPTTLIPVLRTAAPRLTDQITLHIRTEVGALGGPHRRRLHRLVRECVMLALDAFLSLAAGDDAPVARVDERFRELGRRSANSDLGVEPVLAAVQVAADSLWHGIHALVVHDEFTARTVADLGLGMNAYLRRLSGQVQQGFSAERGNLLDARGALLAALLQERSGQDLVALAAAVGWQLPDAVVVLTAQRYGAVPPADLILAPRSLSRLDGDRIIVVTDPEHLASARDALLRLGPRVVVAESWPVRLDQTRDACRWTRRALALVHDGRMRPSQRVVKCSTCRITLLLEADPPLLEQVGADLLKPLSAMKPHYRLMLAETLLRLLETDESASALARGLGVHAQTVRNRIRALRELYGAKLQDPEQRMALILVLEATVPRWQARMKRD
jgi:hypothetical protein